MQLRAEAEASGFGWPYEHTGLGELAETGRPGWRMAALCAHQAHALLATSPHLDPEVLEAGDANAIFIGERRFAASLLNAYRLLADSDNPERGVDTLRLALPAVADELTSWRSPTPPFALPLSLLAAAGFHDLEAESPEGLTCEVLSWLISAGWAVAAALTRGTRYIACFSSSGDAVSAPIGGGPAAADRFLLRAYLNDVPALLSEPELVPHLPAEADEWLLLGKERQVALEATLAGLNVGADFAPTPTPLLPDACREGGVAIASLPGLRFVVGPASQNGAHRWASILVGTSEGTTMIEAALRGNEMRLEAVPGAYAGLEFIERLEALQEHFQEALVLALGQESAALA